MLSFVVHDLWPLPSWCGGWFWSDGHSQLMFLVFFFYLTLLELWQVKLQKTALNTPDAKASFSKKFFYLAFLCFCDAHDCVALHFYAFDHTRGVCHVTTTFRHFSLSCCFTSNVVSQSEHSLSLQTRAPFPFCFWLFIICPMSNKTKTLLHW